MDVNYFIILENQKGGICLQPRLRIVRRTLIVSIEGELDHHMALEVREEIDRTIQKNPVKNLIFDFKNLNFMDSSGVGVVIGRYKQIQKLNGMTSLVHVNPHVMRIIEISGLHKIIPIFKNIEDALEEM